MDAAGARDDPVARHPLVGHAEVVRLMHDELVDLVEGAGIEEQLDPLARGLLARLVLAANTLLTAGHLGGGVATA